MGNKVIFIFDFVRFLYTVYIRDGLNDYGFIDIDLL